MAAARLSMRQIREILRQKWTLGRSHREVAGQLGAGLGTISGVERRARAVGPDWAQVEALSDEALEARLYGPPTLPTRHRPAPDCAALHAERCKPGVTLELLHLEYLDRKDSRFPAAAGAAGASDARSGGGQCRGVRGRRAVPGFSSAAWVASRR